MTEDEKTQAKREILEIALDELGSSAYDQPDWEESCGWEYGEKLFWELFNELEAELLGRKANDG